jgi:probable phosphoglycerate mutase
MALVIYTDGGSRNNPGPAGIGVVAYRGEEQLFTVSEFLGVQTNNWAEYQGVIRALEVVLEKKLEQEPVEIRMDSKLVVEQLLGNWKIKEPSLKPQAARALALIAKCAAVDFTHIPRERNKVADQLANEAMDKGV